MGKLAVPEHILNKPGKLTPAEFDKMKLHASIGADILATINFPYPVVPIVRHHHENWNGLGYPDGIRGTDIPIGARILAVVDCFDALTSDRPYRPRLSDSDALAIVRDRRGSMYDPLVVDTFCRVYKEIMPTDGVGPHHNPFTAITEAVLPQTPLTDKLLPMSVLTATAQDSTLRLVEVSTALAGRVDLKSGVEILADCVRRSVPHDLLALFLYDTAPDDLMIKHAVGAGADALRGFRIGRGERLSGWVAAHRKSIVNSDPALDLAGLVAVPSLKSSLSCPLVLDGSLVGVLSFYATGDKAFTAEHSTIVEAISASVASFVRQSVEMSSSTTNSDVGSLPGLPGVSYIEHLIKRGARFSWQGTQLGVMAVDVTDICDDAHSSSVDKVARLSTCSALVRRSVRLADLVLLANGARIVVLLPYTDSRETVTIADRIGDLVLSEAKRLGWLSDCPASAIGVGVANSSADGDDVLGLIDAALQRTHRSPGHDRMNARSWRVDHDGSLQA
jgi:hypothetical protein